MKSTFLIKAAAGAAVLAVSLSSNAAAAQQATTTATEAVNTAVAPPTATSAATTVAVPAYPAAQVQLPGSLPGTTAADQNGDGIVDGYYTSDGFYHPFVAPVAQPVRVVSRRGERG
jgi:hypothetical protein